MAVVLVVAAGSGCAGSRSGRAEAIVKDGATDNVVTASQDTGGGTRGTGQACASALQCTSGFCVDGFCCDAACDALCMTCGLPTSLGTCTPILSGAMPRAITDCTALAKSTCGLDGTCDGAGKCRNHPSGTVCLPGVCEGTSVVGTNTCDGTGHCEPAASLVCAPYFCNPATNSCFVSCGGDADCVGGRNCTNGHCGTVPGPRCGSNDECASRNCVDGICCNTFCGGACRSCALPGSVGSCVLIRAGLGHPSCTPQDPSTCGTTGLCDGAGACAKYEEGTACGDAQVCQAGSCATAAPDGGPPISQGRR